MKNLETWIYVLVVSSFIRVNGTEYACALGGSDVQLFGTFDDARWRKTELQDEYYKDGFHLVNSRYETDDQRPCYWSRVEKSDGTAHVLAIYKKVVTGKLLQFGLS